MPTETREKMTKDGKGVWSITLGQLPPSIYLYSFTVDGVTIADLVNPRVKLRARTSASMVVENEVRLAGKHPGADIAIEYTGLRPGEKLHETVFHPEEHYSRTANHRVLRSEPRMVDRVVMARTLERLDAMLKLPTDDGVYRAFLRETVPDFRPAGENVVPISLHSKAQPSR